MEKLEHQVEELMSICKQLKQENRELREQLQDNSQHRSQLLEQKDQARRHVEAMINRLKSMEMV